MAANEVCGISSEAGLWVLRKLRKLAHVSRRASGAGKEAGCRGGNNTAYFECCGVG